MPSPPIESSNVSRRKLKQYEFTILTMILCDEHYKQDRFCASSTISNIYKEYLPPDSHTFQHNFTLQTLRIISISSRTSIPRRTGCRPSPTCTTTLTPVRNSSTPRTRSTRWRRTRAAAAGSGSWRRRGRRTKFTLDEGESCLAILGTVTLVRVRVVSVAAVWIG